MDSGRLCVLDKSEPELWPVLHSLWLGALLSSALNRASAELIITGVPASVLRVSVVKELE